MRDHRGLSVRDGAKVYPGALSLSRADFDLRVRAANVLVNENGAGKSMMMMRLIAGVEPLTEGCIELDS